MKKIAVIAKNRCHFEELDKYAIPLLYEDHNPEDRIKLKKSLNDYLWSVVEPYVTFIEINEDNDFLTIVSKELTKCFHDKNPDQFFYHTESSYSCPKKFIELIYCQPLWDTYQKSQIENINNLGCLFSLKHHLVENNCIIIGNDYDLSSPNYIKLTSVSKEDILRVIRRRYFFSAIVVKNDVMVKYYYQDPKYLITKVFGIGYNDSIQKISINHLKYNLTFYFQQDKTKYVNKIATRINGLYRIHGDVIILHDMEENIFTNFSIHECKRLNVLSYGRLYDRQLKEDEVHTVDSPEVDEKGNVSEKKVTPYWSRYLVISRRMLEWEKNKCINCSKEAIKPIICQRCFRAKYCSEECMKEFNNYHYEECMNPF